MIEDDSILLKFEDRSENGAKKTVSLFANSNWLVGENEMAYSEEKGFDALLLEDFLLSRAALQGGYTCH